MTLYLSVRRQGIRVVARERDTRTVFRGYYTVEEIADLVREYVTEFREVNVRLHGSSR